MRYKVIAFGAVAAGAWLLWCTPNSNEFAPQPGEHETAPGEPVTSQGNLALKSVGSAHRSTTTTRPSLSSERVALDRRPWDPDEEMRDVYELRTSVLEAFEQFRDETGISDEKAHELLLILYDYQENKRLIWEQVMEGSELLDEWEFELRLVESTPLRITTGIEANDRIRELLSPGELRAWRRLVHRCNIWWKLGFLPLIKPVSRR